MKHKKRLRADIILIAGVVLAGLILAAVLLLTSSRGETVVVRVDGNTVKTMSLQEDQRYEIVTDKGHNSLVIEGGTAWIEEADCPDGLCVHMGRINRVGQSVVCLPHRVVVEITSDQDDNSDVDIYAK